MLYHVLTKKDHSALPEEKTIPDIHYRTNHPTRKQRKIPEKHVRRQGCGCPGLRLGFPMKMDLSSKMAGSFCRLVCNMTCQFRLVSSHSRALLRTKSFVQSGGQNYFIETNRGSFQLLQRILVAPSCNQRDLLANFCRT